MTRRRLIETDDECTTLSSQSQSSFWHCACELGHQRVSAIKLTLCLWAWPSEATGSLFPHCEYFISQDEYNNLCWERFCLSFRWCSVLKALSCLVFCCPPVTEVGGMAWFRTRSFEDTWNRHVGVWDKRALFISEDTFNKTEQHIMAY